MPGDFNGTWVGCRSEGWKELLEAMKVPLDKLPADLVVTEKITQHGDSMNVSATNNHDSTPKVTAFTVGGVLKTNIMGQDVESNTKWDGNAIVSTEVSGKGTGRREILANGEMCLTIKGGEGYVAKTFYKKH